MTRIVTDFDAPKPSPAIWFDVLASLPQPAIIAHRSVIIRSGRGCVMLSQLISQLRPLLHPMIVHFPIALLFASVALDWAGYWFKQSNLTRAGFYVLVLGALGSGVAALTGPDHVTGDAS